MRHRPHMACVLSKGECLVTAHALCVPMNSQLAAWLPQRGCHQCLFDGRGAFTPWRSDHSPFATIPSVYFPPSPWVNLTRQGVFVFPLLSHASLPLHWISDSPQRLETVYYCIILHCQPPPVYLTQAISQKCRVIAISEKCFHWIGILHINCNSKVS